MLSNLILADFCHFVPVETRLLSLKQEPALQSSSRRAVAAMRRAAASEFWHFQGQAGDIWPMPPLTTASLRKCSPQNIDT